MSTLESIFDSEVKTIQQITLYLDDTKMDDEDQDILCTTLHSRNLEDSLEGYDFFDYDTGGVAHSPYLTFKREGEPYSKDEEEKIKEIITKVFLEEKERYLNNKE